MPLPVSWHFVCRDQGAVVALSFVHSLSDSWEVFGLGAGGKKLKKQQLCFRWGWFYFDWECPADRSSLESLQ